jgi:hypothetical protein
VKKGKEVREQRPKRFFVKVSAPEEQRIRKLAVEGLDLFAPRSDASGHHIDGLLTLDEVGALVEAGFSVLVAGTDEPKLKHKYIGFAEWHREMLADLERTRKES